MSNEIGKGNESTLVHIREVQRQMQNVVGVLSERAIFHDASKLQLPEVNGFNPLGENLRGVTYGSDEYRRVIDSVLGPALHHHYCTNSHHPEYYASYTTDETGKRIYNKDGITKMSLLDLIEMLVDWKAASKRHADGSMFRSFQINRERFGIPTDLFLSLVNTAFELKWLDAEESHLLISTAKEEERSPE